MILDHGQTEYFNRIAVGKMGENNIYFEILLKLVGSPFTLEYITRDHRSLIQNTTFFLKSTLEITNTDYSRKKLLNKAIITLLVKESFVKARVLRFHSKWRKSTLYRG